MKRSTRYARKSAKEKRIRRKARLARKAAFLEAAREWEDRMREEGVHAMRVMGLS